MRSIATACALLAVAALSHTRLSAQTLADSATGFAITPPDSFSVHRTSNRRQFDVGVGIRAKGDSASARSDGGFLCEAGFKSAPQNASLTREQINAFVDDPDWRNLVRANLRMIFEIVTEEPFTLQGYRGVELTLRPKSAAGGGDVRLFMSLVETPKGRTTMVCYSSASGISAALGTFRGLRQTIRLPE
jgi:hypothetical protein